MHDLRCGRNESGGAYDSLGLQVKKEIPVCFTGSVGRVQTSGQTIRESFGVKRHLWMSVLFFSLAGAEAAEIQGRVLDAQGTAVRGAKVTAAHESGRPHAEATTGADGTFLLSIGEPGIYTLTVSVPSGQVSLRREVVVGSPSGSARADFQFQQTTAQTVEAAEEVNPNIFIYRIDLNGLRNRLTVGRGPDPRYIPEFRPEQNYTGSLYGAALADFEVMRPRSLLSAWRGSVSALH